MSSGTSAIQDLCALSKQGIEQFARFIQETRDSENSSRVLLPRPSHILSDPSCLEAAGFSAQIDTGKIFADRLEFGEYLVSQIGSATDDSVLDKLGVWAWLALVYFDQLRNTKIILRGGKYVATQREEHFVPWGALYSTGRSLAYRQCVVTPFRLVKIFGGEARFFLSKDGMHVMGDAIEQVASDKRVMSSQRLRGLIFDLYRDSSGLPKRKAFSIAPKNPKPGSKRGYGGLRRLTDDYLPRLKLAYDVDAMSTDDIVEVCGPEFS
jgi:hypothetical protein